MAEMLAFVILPLKAESGAAASEAAAVASNSRRESEKLEPIIAMIAPDWFTSVDRHKK